MARGENRGTEKDKRLEKVSEKEREREEQWWVAAGLGVGVVWAKMGEEAAEEVREKEVEEEERKGEDVGLADKLYQLRKQTQIVEIAEKLIHGDLQSQTQAARDIRRLVRSSSSSAAAARARSRLVAAGVIPPLVFLLSSSNFDAREASLLALLNVAVRDERNKIKIVASGAIPPLVKLLKTQSEKLPDLATAAILTLSAPTSNKPIIISSGVAPLLIRILSCGTIQGKVDAVTALYNLSTSSENPNAILNPSAAAPLLALLKECKKYSKFAEKATALLEVLSCTEEGRNSIAGTCGGILTLVETVEDGSLVSTEHAVGTLLSLCLSCRSRYRELILNEGAIPGLLRLTVEGTQEAGEKARKLLDLLRESPKEERLASLILEEIVCDIAKKVDGVDKANETAKKLLQDMVRRSMELSVKQLQVQAASSCNQPSEPPMPS